MTYPAQCNAPPGAGEPAAGTSTPSQQIRSEDLFRQAREVEIMHAGRIYRLRLTQQNKLILTA